MIAIYPSIFLRWRVKTFSPQTCALHLLSVSVVYPHTTIHSLHCGESRMTTEELAGERVTLGSELFSLTVSVSEGEPSHRPSADTSSVTQRRRSSSEKGPRDCDSVT